MQCSLLRRGSRFCLIHLSTTVLFASQFINQSGRRLFSQNLHDYSGVPILEDIESEPSPTSAHACGEVTGWAPGMYVTFASAKKRIRQNPLWLWTPEETSPEIQNRGISGPQKRTCVRQILKKKLYWIDFPPLLVEYVWTGMSPTYSPNSCS